MSNVFSPVPSYQPASGPPEYQQLPPRDTQQGSWGRSCLFALLGLVAGVFLVGQIFWLFRPRVEMPPKVREQYFSHDRRAWDKVAIITLEGMILDEEEGFVKRQIDQALQDDRVKAVVLRVNSPGGTITDADFLYHHLSKLRDKKPLVVSMGSVAASGAYYVSMAVGHRPDTIFAEPTTWTGSIGVIIFHMNVEQLLARLGVETDPITSAPLKDMGSLFRKMTPEERGIFQGLVDKSLARFKEVIRSGRAKFADDPAALDNIATGQIFTAKEALELGLVDRIGFLEDAVERAIELAGLDPSQVCVIRYKREVGLADLIWGSDFISSKWYDVTLTDLRKRLALLSPRAFYLMTGSLLELQWLELARP
ncbi:MAG: signal peptide peptidase SppA [Thermoguttaceae bacterium]|nr:signal peptide peptidase SppA [Thermoguttaceae bacterium]MDW8078094.1 signal peptide peptidase SppA [Thermoguttaceae bacterium]